MKKNIFTTLVLLIIVIVLGFLTKEKHNGYSQTTNVTVLTPICDFGDIKQNSVSDFQLIIVNNTFNPLFVKSINKSSRLIDVYKKPQYYNTSDTIKIPIRFTAQDKKGQINESITINGNFKEGEVTIKIIGNIID